MNDDDYLCSQFKGYITSELYVRMNDIN